MVKGAAEADEWTISTTIPFVSDSCASFVDPF